MENKVLKIMNAFLLSVLTAVIILLAVFGTVVPSVAYAAESEEVLRDLRRDKTFNEEDYPYVKDDYALYVIQIGESSNKELFVYVYQPCHDTYDLLGTKISISYGYSVDGAGLNPQLYNLKLVSTSGTLDKYYVEGFTVPNDGDRYYNIVEIFRMVNVEIDEVDEQFPKTDMAYNVGQQWYVCDLNDSKYYEMNTFNTLNVETIFMSNLNFSNGIQLKNFVGLYDDCDCWFYCFNVDDYVIKHIYDADLNYSVRDAIHGVGLFYNETEYSNERLHQVITLKDTDVMKHNGDGLFASDYEWNRILSSSEFVEYAEEQDVEFVENDKEKILSSQWVFTFLETERRFQYSNDLTFTYYSDVYDVGLLRLHFQDVTGRKYDLGVVNDLVDPDNIASGTGTLDFSEALNSIRRIILFILGVLILLLILRFLPSIVAVLKFIFKAIGWVISLPFRFLKRIFQRRK